MKAGSLVNKLYDEATCAAPEVGMGATVVMWTDRKAATVVEVSASGDKVVLQADTATRTDSNGMSDAQSYSFERNPDGVLYTASRRKDGSYRLSGGETRVLFGARDHYHDFSF